MEGKLGPIVEGDGAPHGASQGVEHVGEMPGGSLGLSILCLDHPFAQGTAVLDEVDHAAALAGEPTPPVPGAGQQAMPIVLLR